MKRIMKVVLFKKGEYGKTTHKKINVDEFRKLINSPSFQDDLASGRMLGLFTHSLRNTCRTKPGAPVADNVANSEDLATKVLSVEETPIDFRADLEVLYTEKSDRFISLLKSGTKFCVSMSTESDVQGDEFIVRKLWGVDITLLPEFTSDIIDMNFSQQTINPGYYTSPEIQYFQFSAMSNEDFSLKEYIQEREKYTPAIILKNRIVEVTRYINMLKPQRFEQEKNYIRAYITSYLKEYITKVVSSNENINLLMNLRLNQYLKPEEQTEVRNLQNALNKAKNTLDDDGTILRQQQQIISRAFDVLTYSVFDYIDEKVGDPNKRLNDDSANNDVSSSSQQDINMSIVEDLVVDGTRDELSRFDFSALSFSPCSDDHLTELLRDNDYDGVIRYREIVGNWCPKSESSMDGVNALVYSTEIPIKSLVGNAALYKREGQEIPLGMKELLTRRGIQEYMLPDLAGESIYDLLESCADGDDAEEVMQMVLTNKDRFPLGNAQATDFGLKAFANRIATIFNRGKKPLKIVAPDETDNNNIHDDVRRPVLSEDLTNADYSRSNDNLIIDGYNLNNINTDRIDRDAEGKKHIPLLRKRSGEIPQGDRQDRNPNLARSVGGNMYGRS